MNEIKEQKFKNIMFKGYQVDICGRIINTIKSNLDCEHINCPQTSRHSANIVTKRANDVEVTYFEDQDNNYGVEVYFFKSGTEDIKYSRVYRGLNEIMRMPTKYKETVVFLMGRHDELFKN